MSIKLFLCMALAAVTLGACASSPLAGYSNLPLAQNVIYQNEDCAAGKCVAGSNVNPERIVPQRAIQVATHYSITCDIDMNKQVAGLGTSVVGGAAVMVLPGLGLGPVAHAAFSYAKQGPYAVYGAGANALNGAATGAILGGQNMANAKGNCTKGKFSDVQTEFVGTHVDTVTGGKALSPYIRTDAPQPSRHH